MQIEITERQARILKDLLLTDMAYLSDEAIPSADLEEDKNDLNEDLEAEKDIFNKVNI